MISSPQASRGRLPERILGASAEPFWDDFIHDPAKVAAIKSLHLAYTRFPGGSQSNYYDWKRGLFFVPAGANHSPYYELFVRLSSFVARKFPEGFSLEQYKAFSDSIDAEVVMVPNLETASVEDQVEWFKHLSAKGAVPTHIELGNEFWVAMGQDPVVLRRWPDEPTAMQVTKRYLDAFRAYLPKGAKVAVQAAAPSFHGEPSSRGAMIKRLRRWNEDLKPEPWFDAVTIHLYPRLNEVVGRGAAEEAITPQIARRNLRALMARVDEGTDGVVRRYRTARPRQGDLGHGMESRRVGGGGERESRRDDDSRDDAATGHPHDPGFPAAPAGDGRPVLLDPLQARQPEVHVPGGKRRLPCRARGGRAALAECRRQRRCDLPAIHRVRKPSHSRRGRASGDLRCRGSGVVPKQGPCHPDSPERLGRSPPWKISPT